MTFFYSYQFDPYKQRGTFLAQGLERKGKVCLCCLNRAVSFRFHHQRLGENSGEEEKVETGGKSSFIRIFPARFNFFLVRPLSVPGSASCFNFVSADANFGTPSFTTEDTVEFGLLYRLF